MKNKPITVSKVDWVIGNVPESVFAGLVSNPNIIIASWEQLSENAYKVKFKYLPPAGYSYMG